MKNLNFAIRSVLIATIFLFILALPIGAFAAQIEHNNITQISGDIYIQEDEVILGDVVNLHGNTTVAGRVHGNIVNVWGDVILLDGSTVSGDIVVLAGKVQRNGSATLDGSIINKSFDNREYSNYGKNDHSVITSLIQLLGLLGATVLAISIFPKSLNTMSTELTRDLLRIFLIGLAAWILLPFVLLVLTITIIGIPIMILLVLLIPLIFIISALVCSIALGTTRLRPMLSNTFNWAKEPNLLIEGLLGILTLWLVSQAPFVGWLVAPITAIFGMGVLISTKFGTNRPWFPKKIKNRDERDIYE